MRKGAWEDDGDAPVPSDAKMQSEMPVRYMWLRIDNLKWANTIERAVEVLGAGKPAP